MEKIIFWKMYFILLTACTLGVIFVFPYILTVQKDLFANLPVSLPIFFAAQIIQSLITFSLAIVIGLKIYKSSGFKLPFLESYLSAKKTLPGFLSTLKTSVKWGIFTAISIALCDYLFSIYSLNLLAGVSINIPAWQRFLVAFYGGLNEEIIMRFFLMTLVVWIFLKFSKKSGTGIYWAAILVTSIIFGLGHLPITASMTEITLMVILRAIILNSIGGIVFGWLYWKKGLEAAVIAHFTADIFLHLLIPSLFGFLLIS